MGNYGHVARDFQVVGFYFHVRFFVFAPVVFGFLFFVFLQLSPFLSLFSLCCLGHSDTCFSSANLAREDRQQEQPSW